VISVPTITLEGGANGAPHPDAGADAKKFPGRYAQVWLVASPALPYGEKQPLAKFTTNVSGAQIAQAIGPLRQVVTGDGAATGYERRFLLVDTHGAWGLLFLRSAISRWGGRVRRIVG
jgi:hypothetical protein